MGGALLSGWIGGGALSAAAVVEPAKDAAVPGTDGGERAKVRHVRALAELGGELAFEAAVLAVKPQQMDPVLAELAPRLEAGTLVLSIAAGKSIAYFEARLGQGRPVCRAMHNTPAAIGAGVSVLCANAAVGPAQRELAAGLMRAGGRVYWVEAEADLAAVTALSGSGPAYAFLLMEAMAEAGAALGLDPGFARELAVETVLGAGRLAARAGEAPAKLRENVTSPGGTTEAALRHLLGEAGMKPLIARAMAEAAARAREI